jgi:hypothetical protein
MGGAGKVNLAAGAGLVLASSLTAMAWAARRRRLRAATPGPASPVPGRAVAARTRPGAGLLLGCDELPRLAEREDDWW